MLLKMVRKLRSTFADSWGRLSLSEVVFNTHTVITKDDCEMALMVLESLADFPFKGNVQEMWDLVLFKYFDLSHSVNTAVIL